MCVFSHFGDTCFRVDVVFDGFEEKSIKDSMHSHKMGKKTDQSGKRLKTSMFPYQKFGNSSLISQKTNEIL